MLGKLLKYEVKATGRVFLPMYLALIGLIIITKISLSLTTPKFNFGSSVLDLFAQIGMALSITIIVALSVMTFIVVIQRFYKNFLTDEGYLMFTLPVKTRDLILSKLLVACLWFVVCSITITLAIFILAFSAETFSESIKFLGEASTAFSQEFGKSLMIPILEFVLLGIVGTISSILMIYVSIALGQLFNEHRVMASFGMYIGLTVVLQILGSIVVFAMTPWMASLDGMLIGPKEGLAIIELSLNIMSLVSILLSVGFYFGTHYLLGKKLNLE